MATNFVASGAAGRANVGFALHPIAVCRTAVGRIHATGVNVKGGDAIPPVLPVCLPASRITKM